MSGTTHEQIIAATADHVRQVMTGDPGHDWWHVYRVWRLARRIATAEGADDLLVSLAALLHDLGDAKLHNYSTPSEPARIWLESETVDPTIITEVCYIIDHMSFKGAAVEEKPLPLAGQVVQDADRLEALGAIGIARAFSYGGYKHRPLYDPDQPPVVHNTAASYYGDKGSTINHFYEKLFLVKDRLHTATAKQIAGERHKFMEEYIARFMDEWQGSDS